MSYRSWMCAWRENLNGLLRCHLSSTSPKRRRGAQHCTLGLGLLTISLTALFPVTVSFAEPASFGAATQFPVGMQPVSVAIGDLNGDGKPDLAVPNALSNDISILLGAGAGAFSAAVSLAVGTQPVSVAIGDLNGDGKPDLAVANSGSNTVSILLGDGAGAFVLDTSPAVGSNPVSVAIGDLNLDGKPDLAVANSVSHTISILLGTGTGAFGSATNFFAPSPRIVTIGDLNGDGKPDLAVANGNISGSVLILLGDGTGAFGAATSFTVGTGPIPVAIGDLNRDGKPDLAVANQESNNVSILLGDGTGAFGAATNLAAGTFPFSIAIGDLNRDGKPDLAVVNGDGDAVILLNAPVVDTPTGNNVSVQPVDDTSQTAPVTATFSSVTAVGDTTLSITTGGPPPPTGFQLGTPPTYYDLSTTATFVGPVTVCIDYTAVSFSDESTLRLMHFEDPDWVDVTTSLDTVAKIICGNVTSLSLFAVFEEARATFQFSGFFPSVDNPGPGPAFVFNKVNAGRAIPVKFSLSGDQGLDIFAPGYPGSANVDCSTAGFSDVIEETVTAGQSSLSYDAASDRYTYVWKTNKAWAGTCRKLVVRLTDGTDHVAYFDFRK